MAIPDLSLAGQVAVVTGAAGERGAGRGIALMLAEAGADVAVCDYVADVHDRDLSARAKDMGAEPGTGLVPEGMCNRAHCAIFPFTTALWFRGRFPWVKDPDTHEERVAPGTGIGVTPRTLYSPAGRD